MKLDDFTTLSISTRKEWRAWLEKYHHREKEIWLIYFKKHTLRPAQGKPARKSISYDDALDEALCFGWIDGKVRSIDDERYMQRYTPRTKKSQWSANNVARYKRLMKEGRMTQVGKRAFAAKSRVYTPVLGKNAYEWHMKNKMGRTPSLEKRIAWHREHQRVCGCRQIPVSIQKAMKDRR